MDKRIGISATNTTPAVWPETDIRGNAYERGNGVMAHIGSKHFAVLPIGYVDDGTLEQLRKQYKEVLTAPEPETAQAEEPPAEDLPTERKKR